jgi:hypothetical protein
VCRAHSLPRLSQSAGEAPVKLSADIQKGARREGSFRLAVSLPAEKERGGPLMTTTSPNG